MGPVRCPGTQSTGRVSLLWDPSDGDIAFVARRGVGTLLLCELLDAPISRSRDQPFPGHFFTFEWPGYEVIHEWRPIAGVKLKLSPRKIGDQYKRLTERTEAETMTQLPA